MVRKRGRGRGSATALKRRTSRSYDSDENESDVELNLESPPVSPEEPKRYGLRQRTKRPILTDYYYDDDDETIPTKDESDNDQDYDVVEDLEKKHLRVTERVFSSHHTERRKSTRERPESARIVTESRVVDPPVLSHSSRSGDRDGPVDFEDMIRADVVNKQKLDYDSTVNKTEIHVEPLPLLKISKVQKVTPVTGRRRGRRPKEPKNEENDYHITAESVVNDLNSIITNGDSNEPMEVQLDPTQLMSEYLDDPREGKENGVAKEDKQDEKPNKDRKCSDNTDKPNGIAITIKAMDKPDACEPPDLDPKEKEVVLSNEYLLANAFDYSAEEFVKKQEEDKNKPEVEEDEPVKQLIFESDDNSDDDVILIEKKPEIIVLDDDD